MSDSTVLLDQFGKPLTRVNGHSHAVPKPRRALVEAMLANQTLQRRMSATYDAARDTEEYRRHWANTDARDADGANSKEVRHKLMRRSRYEQGSNGIYSGIIETHCNMVVGVGPTLRMLTKNRNFNQFVEREFFKWYQRVQLRRKLWCMQHARTQDGEAFAILQTNPVIPTDQVQLDVQLIEAEQCQTPYLPFMEFGYIDGKRFDEHNNILWYDVLPFHPGASQQLMNVNAIRVPPKQMLHWFKMERPGEHRSTPSLKSTLNLGASSRRMREATVRKAEIQADFSVLLESILPPDPDEQAVTPWTTLEVEKGMMTMLPDGMKSSPLTVDTPSAQYSDFNRTHISELASPIGQPYNVAAKDSSTYSFASGKLDTLCYRAALDVERQDCNDLVLDPLFGEWFGEWSLIGVRFDGPPTHQWDWPAHPVIDVMADASANDTKLKNGTVSLRDVYTEQSKDFEDQLSVMAEDAFGEATDETILKMRQIVQLKNTPAHAIEHVAQIMGVELPEKQSPGRPQPTETISNLSHASLWTLKQRLDRLEPAI